MKITTNYKNIENSQIQLDIAISLNEVLKIFEETAIGLVKEVNIPGFRKGKVPVNIIKSKYYDHIKGTTIEECISKSIEQAIKDEKLEIIGDYTVKDIEKIFKEYLLKEDLKITVFLNKKPSCEVKNYDNLLVGNYECKIKEEDVEVTLKEILKKTR